MIYFLNIHRLKYKRAKFIYKMICLGGGGGPKVPSPLHPRTGLRKPGLNRVKLKNWNNCLGVGLQVSLVGHRHTRCFASNWSQSKGVVLKFACNRWNFKYYKLLSNCLGGITKIFARAKGNPQNFKLQLALV